MTLLFLRWSYDFLMKIHLNFHYLALWFAHILAFDFIKKPTVADIRCFISTRTLRISNRKRGTAFLFCCFSLTGYQGYYVTPQLIFVAAALMFSKHH